MDFALPESRQNQTELSKILDVQMIYVIELFFEQIKLPTGLRISGLMSSLKSMGHKDPIVRSRGK